MNIREQKGYTYSPRSSVHGLRQHGYLTIHAAVRNEVTAATLTEMFYEMDRLRALPVGEAELSDARNYQSGVFSLGLATQDGLAGQLATVYLNEMPEDFLETYREKVRAITSEDVLRVARKYFDSANAQIVIVGDRAQVEEQAALFGDVEVHSPQGN
jgi:zinc protease